MVSTVNKKRLKSLMKKEIDLLNKFSGAEETMRSHISNKDWEGLEVAMQNIQPISEKLQNIEAKRHETFNDLKKDIGVKDDAGFYQVIVHLPDAERELCSDLYRKLKLAVLRMQGVNWSIDNQVEHLNGTLHNVLDEIFPYRKGKMYSKSGKLSGNNHAPLVLNHQS